MGPAVALPIETMRSLRQILRKENRFRDLALLCVHVDSCLRAGDVLSLRVGDVVERRRGAADVAQRSVFHVREEKTGKITKCCLLLEAKRAVRDYLTECAPPHGYLFPGRYPDKPLTVRAYQLLVKEWEALLRWARVPLPNGYLSTHSFRRSKPTYLYEQEHDIIACQRLLNHTKLDTTLKYLQVGSEAGHELAARHPF